MEERKFARTCGGHHRGVRRTRETFLRTRSAPTPTPPLPSLPPPPFSPPSLKIFHARSHFINIMGKECRWEKVREELEKDGGDLRGWSLGVVPLSVPAVTFPVSARRTVIYLLDFPMRLFSACSICFRLRGYWAINRTEGRLRDGKVGSGV